MYWIELLTWEKDRKEANLKNAEFRQTYEEKVKATPTYLNLLI